MKRILVEFYSEDMSENLVSLLQEAYDGVVFVYFAKEKKPTRLTRARLKETLQKHFGFAPSFLPIGVCNLETTLSAFSRLPKSNRYDFDLTGGNEIFIAAAGFFAAREKNRSIFLHQYHVKSGKKIFSYPENTFSQEFFPTYLSAPEILSLEGAIPISLPRYPSGNEALREEILRLWTALTPARRDWNAFCSIPIADGVFRDPQTEGARALGREPRFHRAWRAVTARLEQANIIQNCRTVEENGQSIGIFQWNLAPEARFLWEKAGNLLEYYSALAADESGIFHDIRVGSLLDWNGSTAPPRQPDPKNEIDLILMHRNLPVFASCKNTVPHNDYLYEILTMTRHFGGLSATPMLIATEKASFALRQRAREMGILLLDDVGKNSTEALAERFRRLFP